MTGRVKRKRSLLSQEAHVSTSSEIPDSSPPYVPKEDEEEDDDEEEEEEEGEDNDEEEEGEDDGEEEGEDEDEEDVPLPPRSRRRSQVMRQRHSARRTMLGTVRGIMAGGADAVLSSERNDMPSVQDGLYTNMAVVENWLQDVSVLTVRGRVTAPPEAKSLLTVMQAPIHDNRQCELTQIKNPTKQFPSYVARIVDKGSSSSFDKEGVTFPFATDYYLKADVEKCAVQLCRFLERWPHEASNKMSAAIKRAIVASIAEATCPEVPRVFGSVRYYEPHDAYITEITSIDPESGNQYAHKEVIKPRDMVDVGDLQQDIFENCIFGVVRERNERFPCPHCGKEFGSPGGLKYHLVRCEKAPKKEEDETAASSAKPPRKKRAKAQTFEEPTERAPIPKYESCVPNDIEDEELRQKHVAAEWLCKFLAVKLNHKAISSLNVPRLCELYGKQFANWKKPYRGIYGGKPLCTLQAMKRSRQTRIRPSSAVQKDLSKVPPYIMVNSLLRTRCVTILDAMNGKWLESGDLLATWKTAAMAADVVNMSIVDGDPPATVCNCEQPAESIQLHPCGYCLASAICSSLQAGLDGVRVCYDCRSRDRGVGFQSLPADLIKLALKDLIIDDGKKLGVEFDQSIFDKAWDDLRKNFPDGDTWVDDYAAEPRRMEIERLGAKGAFRPSVDAVFPFTAVNEQYRVHAEGNVAITAYYLNTMKNLFIPGVLAIIKEYQSLRGTEEEREDLIFKMNDIHQVGILSPYSKRARSLQEYSDRHLDDMRTMWVTGKPSYRPKRADLYMSSQRELAMRAYWQPKGVDRILALVESIEKHFDVPIPRGDDNCPYPFHPMTIPDDWCWWTCWALFTERTYRMWLLCNRKWKQIDVCETLYLEAIWQAADPNYSEFLKLPLSIYVRHPLRFVAAHKSHGQQLRTGWTTTTPSSIADRVDSLNNMLFETHVSNMAKHNFSEATCEAISADIANISIPLKWYDPSREAEFQAPEEQDDTEDEFDDVFGGGEIDEGDEKE